MFPFFSKIDDIAACFRDLRRVFYERVRLKINFSTGIKIPEQPFTSELGMTSRTTGFNGRRHYIASEFETGDEDKISVH
jgi:hypothetical protein